MKKEEIFAKVAQCASGTVLSFPERGPWGSSKYRGNFSGWIPASLIYRYDAKSVSEIFAGGGTTSDLCKDLEIPYLGLDLNPNPVRKDIVSADILDKNLELPDFFYEADMQILHPPYPSINDVHYSNCMWQGNGNEQVRDIQEMSWEQGMHAVNIALMKGFSAMPAGSYQAVVIGDIRRKVNGVSTFRSMLKDLVFPGEVQQILIKMQHNTVSGRKGGYNRKMPFFLIEHEFVVVTKKPSGYEITYVMPREYSFDVRDSRDATWKDVLSSVMQKLGRQATLQQIYQEVDGHKKCASNPNWTAKVRQTLQRYAMFQNVEPGVWRMAD